MERSTANPDMSHRPLGGRTARVRRCLTRPVALLGVVVAMTAWVVAGMTVLVGPSSAAAAKSPKPAISKSGIVHPGAPASTHRVTFGIEPASASGPDGRPFFRFGVTPGGVLRDNVAVVDYSKVPLTLELSATDAVETSGGGFGLLPPGVKPTGAGSWISLAPGTTTVQVPAESPSGTPGSTVVAFSVHVPFKVTPGDHVGGIVATLRTVGTNPSGGRIVLNQRIGTRVYVQVTGKLVPRLAVGDLHATYQGTIDPFGTGTVQVTYTLRNTGNVDLAVDQSVAVSEVVGATRRVNVTAIPLLLPGASVSERAVVTGIWPQFLLGATVTARPHVPSGSGVPNPRTVTVGTSVWAVPWPLIVLIVLIVFAVYLARRYRRRVRTGKEAGGSGGEGTGSGGTTGPVDAAGAEPVTADA
jgi:hypothetical protein